MKPTGPTTDDRRSLTINHMLQSGSKVFVKCSVHESAFDPSPSLYYAHRADGVKRLEYAESGLFRPISGNEEESSVQCTFVELTDWDAALIPGPDGYRGEKGFVVILPGGEKAVVFASDIVIH